MASKQQQTSNEKRLGAMGSVVLPAAVVTKAFPRIKDAHVIVTRQLLAGTEGDLTFLKEMQCAKDKFGLALVIPHVQPFKDEVKQAKPEDAIEQFMAEITAAFEEAPAYDKEVFAEAVKDVNAAFSKYLEGVATS